jgi:omega-6 fatty acid desaturase (delta-12 desaturase)
MEPSEIRAGIPPACHRRAVVLPWVLIGFWVALYLASWVAIFRVPGPARFPCALLNGTFVGVLFVIAHDACHGAFASERWMNHFIGRVAFLPSLHPFSHWDYVHNRQHHGWTNLKPKDYVWAPFSKDEFDALPAWRRFVEKVGRTWWGVAVHYAVVIWWPRFARPSGPQRADVATPGVVDWLLEAAFLAIQLGAGFALEATRGGGYSVAGFVTAAFLGVFVPFAVFTWMLGMVTFVQHNHERVRWYDRRDEWSFARGALWGTVHVELPLAVDTFLLNCMFHTAHHVDVRVPLYRLPAAQRTLERIHGDGVIQIRMGLGAALDTFRRCKLYDYRRHEWLDFAGLPTAQTRPGSHRQSTGQPSIA